MAQFVITHGSFKVGKQHPQADENGMLGVGKVIDLDAKEAARHPGCLQAKLEHDAEMAGKEAASKAKAAVMSQGKGAAK